MLKVQLIWFELYAVLWEQECRSQQVRHVAIMEIVRNDHLGSVTRIIRSNGAQVFLLRYAPQASPDVAERSAQYDPWGVQTVTTNTIGFSRGYCGHEMLNGDLVISLDTVRTNAELFHKTYEEELYRVIIHGVLLLCGINDKGPGERELMEAAENKALKTLLPALPIGRVLIVLKAAFFRQTTHTNNILKRGCVKIGTSSFRFLSSALKSHV